MSGHDIDQEIRLAIRRLEPTVNTDGFWWAIRPRLDGAGAGRRKAGRSLGARLSVAAVTLGVLALAAGIGYGAYQLSHQIDRSRPVIVIGDDTTLGTTGEVSQAFLDNPYPSPGVVASGGAGRSDWAMSLGSAIVLQYPDRDWEVLRAEEQDHALMEVIIGPSGAQLDASGMAVDAPTIRISVHREESGRLPHGSNPMQYPEFTTTDGHGLIVPRYNDGRKTLLSWFIRPDRLMIQVAAPQPRSGSSSEAPLLDEDQLEELVSFIASIIKKGNAVTSTTVAVTPTTTPVSAEVQAYLDELEALWRGVGIPVLRVSVDYPDELTRQIIEENTDEGDVLPYAALELPRSAFESTDALFIHMAVMRMTMVAVHRGVPLHHLCLIEVADDGSKTVNFMSEVFQLAGVQGSEWDRPAKLDLAQTVDRLTWMAQEAARTSGVTLEHLEVIEDASGRVVTAVGSVADRSTVAALVRHFSAPLETDCWNLNKAGAKISGLYVKVDDVNGAPVMRRVVGYNVGGGASSRWMAPELEAALNQ